MIELKKIENIGDSYIFLVDKVPNKCPSCKRDISSQLVADSLIRDKHGDVFSDMVFKCNHKDCASFYTCSYYMVPTANKNEPEWLLNEYIEPYIPYTFNKFLLTNFTNFCQIFEEAIELYTTTLNL